MNGYFACFCAGAFIASTLPHVAKLFRNEQSEHWTMTPQERTQWETNHPHGNKLMRAEEQKAHDKELFFQLAKRVYDLETQTKG